MNEKENSEKVPKEKPSVDTVLKGSGVSKFFGGLKAVDDVNIQVRQGQIVGLIGPNGAGKTTLFNCITGITIPTRGCIRFKGVDLVPPVRTDLMEHLKKISSFFMGLSLLWTLVIMAMYIPRVTFPMETAIAIFSVGAFRIFLGLKLRQAVPWSRGVTLLFASLDVFVACWWLVGLSRSTGDDLFFDLFSIKIVLLPLGIVMLSYPLYFFLLLLRQDVKTLFGIFLRPDAVAKLGIARTFQNIRLFSNLSVLDNVKIGRHCRARSNFFTSVFRTVSQRKEEKEITHKALEALDFVNLRSKASFVASNLPYGEQRMLEIARALATEPELLLLDEPAAGMNPNETDQLMKLIRRIRDLGISILLIEHDMRVIMRISDHIFVLDHGKSIAEGKPEEVKSNPRVVEAYLGSEYAAG
jgi:ABC-type branched-subunit amino acid transport system ATPase component